MVFTVNWGWLHAGPEAENPTRAFPGKKENLDGVRVGEDMAVRKEKMGIIEKRLAGKWFLGISDGI